MKDVMKSGYDKYLAVVFIVCGVLVWWIGWTILDIYQESKCRNERLDPTCQHFVPIPGKPCPDTHTLAWWGSSRGGQAMCECAFERVCK